ncbi:MAG: ABC transporter ATP-binding protein [Patescibacteria group bacterium]|nr:ABC transporter ATP-binding protein [Patescibacteria group bacterium]
MIKKIKDKSKLKFRQAASKLWQIIKPHRGLIFWRFLLVIAAQFTWPFQSLFIKYIIDNLISSAPIIVIARLVLYWVIYQIIAIFIEHLSFYVGEYTSGELEKKINKHTINKTLNFSVGQYTNENTGIKASKINRGVNSFAELVSVVFWGLVPEVLLILFYTIALFIFGWQFGIISLAVIALNMVVTFVLNRRWIGPRNMKSEKQYNDFDSYKWELYHNVDIVKQNAKEIREKQRANLIFTSLTRYAVKTWQKATMLIFASRNMPGAIMSGVTVFIGAWLIYKGAFTVGSLVVILQWVSSLYGELRHLMGTERYIFKHYEPVRNLLEMLEIKPAVVSVENSTELNLHGDIEFKHISFRYEGKKTALKDVSFHIKAGETVAFVGESGSGKTTVVRLLQRFYDPNQGRILIDNHDLREINLEQYLSKIGAVSQEVKLFDTTLRKNILYGLPLGEKINDKQLEAVAKLARIDKFYSRLDKKFETLIGENGVKLSGGEKQRVSIARAMIKNPKILIFDEATSSLDVESESEIHKAIMAASKGRTTILIAHRLSTVIGADRIFVMKKGKIVGEGNHGSLMKSNSYYARLMKIQVLDLIKHNFPNLDQDHLHKVLRDLGVE